MPNHTYVDNGDGTVTDTNTGLMWEKISDDGSIHDKDDRYMWTDAFTKIATLNSTNFAGHTDWRLPNVNELVSIVNYGASDPAVDAAFNTNCAPGCTATTCSCTMPAVYWSSDPFGFPIVRFDKGLVANEPAYIPDSVRAVRGGS